MDSSKLPTPLNSLPVAVDAMGGDLGPSVVVEGALCAARELGIRSTLIGKEDQLKAILNGFGASTEKLISIEHAAEVISMEDSPSVAIRGKEESSIRKAFESVKQGKNCAVVSPGNTGAMMAAGVFVSGTLPGIARPAIASLIPNTNSNVPTVLLDSGANVDCHAHQLVQFALMGSYYAKSILHCETPRVGLLSNGSEASKGNDITRSAAQILAEYEGVNFLGYIEGRDMGHGKVDVIVCDGFVGNIVLKTIEGSVSLVLDAMKNHIKNSTRGKFGMWLAKPIFKSLFQEKLDPSAYGGAPLLGLNDIAIVCHGTSNAKAIMNAVRVADLFVKESLITKIAAALSALDLKMPGAYENGMWGRIGQKFEKKKSAKVHVNGNALVNPSEVEDLEINKTEN